MGTLRKGCTHVESRQSTIRCKMNRLVLVCGLLAWSAAVSQGQNLAEKATQLGLSSLVDMLTKAELADTIATGGPFTVFAPTNDAFSALPQSTLDVLNNNNTALQEVLKYHVVSGKVMSTDLTNEMTADSLQAAKIRINIYQKTSGTVITATGSQVTTPDQEASNGVIHVVNRVMYPIPTADIPGLVTSEPNYSTLLTAVSTAELVQTLKGGPFTIFGPDNTAFGKVPSCALDALLKNKTALTKVLTYHVVTGTFYSAGLESKDITTVEGSKVSVMVGSDVKVGGATVNAPNLAATNGVIHGIDAVLLPPGFSLPTCGASSLQATTLMLILFSLLYLLW